MSAPWFLFSLLAPAAAALTVTLALRGRRAEDPVVILLNALMPGAGVAAAGRPLVEVVAGVILSTVSLFTIGRTEDLGYWVPIMVVGAAWGLLYTRFNPLTRERPVGSSSPEEAVTSPARRSPPGAA